MKIINFTLWLFVFTFSLFASQFALANTVSGTIRYENKTYDSSSGFTGITNYRVVRFANVEVVVGGSATYTGNTDASGFYSIAIPDAGTKLVFIRIYARQNDASYNVIVKNNTSSNATYTSATSSASLDTNNPQIINRDITIASGAAGAFNIFDCGIWSWQFMASVQSPMPGVLPQMIFYWQSGGTTGTYFSPSLNAVFLVGGASDPDEFDDDVIMHEVGHFIASNFSEDDSPGGAHAITGQYDPRLTWSEGWATFWSCRVKNYAGGVLYPEPEAYVDNFGVGFATFEVETPSFSGSAIMATNELAVSAVLWDIADNTPIEGADPTLAEGDQPVWDVFYNDLPVALQVTLEDFFKGWRTRNPGLVVATQTLFNTRSIKYSDDGLVNNTAGTATTLAGTLNNNTFYDVGDIDWFKFTLGVSDHVTIETLSLGDGCDTFMDLIDTNGVTVLASNDDRTGSDNSSIIQRTFSVAGTYYARIKSFDGAGRITEFGYYSVRLTISPNVAPSLSISASTTAGTAPLRVSFNMTASDSDGSIASYEWDFNGDGKYDYSSTQSGSTTYIYSGGGTFSATAKVVDNAGGVKLQSIVITPTQPSSSASVTANATAVTNPPTAPVTADFSATISSLTPASYQWDFDGDGIIDYASITTATTQHIYRSAGSFISMLTVTDTNGISYTAPAPQITVAPPGSLPTVTVSASVSNGSIPLVATLDAIATGAVSKYSWDFDGDGIIDQETTSASVTHTYTQVGTLYYTAYVTTSGNLTASDSGIIRPELSIPSGYIVTPKMNDSVTGSSLSIVAEVLPYGVSKTVQFQYRIDTPGSWINIGSPITSTGTIFTVTWDVSSFINTDVYDVRALINSSISTGNDLNTVTIDSISPDVNEYIDGLGRRVKEEIVILDKTTRVVTGENAEFIFPVGSSSSPSDPTLQVTGLGSNAHPINGAATGLTATNRNYELTMISGTSTFDNNFSIRIPFLGLSGFDASTLRILWWDTVSSTWKQDYQSVVSNTDKYVEVKASHMTEFGLFGSPSSGGGGGGGGGCFIATAVYGNPNDANVISLIKFRDCYVSTTAVGRTFITTYNTIGPRIANTIGDSYLIKEIAEVGLYPIVTIAKIAQLSTLLKVFILLLFANLVIAVVIRRLMANIIKD